MANAIDFSTFVAFVASDIATGNRLFFGSGEAADTALRLHLQLLCMHLDVPVPAISARDEWHSAQRQYCSSSRMASCAREDSAAGFLFSSCPFSAPGRARFPPRQTAGGAASTVDMARVTADYGQPLAAESVL
jgi:hypothetical protein